MRFAISIPQHVADGTFDPAAMRRYLARAEELGFASAWTQEQVLGTIPNLAPVETLTYAAACTERMRLGCAVFITSLHSPVHLAKSLSTLDQISRGRLEVGIGTGGPNRMFSALDRLYGYFGLPDLTPVSVFGPPDDCVRGLRDVAAAGAELILVNPLFDDEEQMERLAGEVIPQLP